MNQDLLLADLETTVAMALREDIRGGDVTAELIPAEATSTARVLLREPAIVCGRPWFDETFRQLDPTIRIDWRVEEGGEQPADAIVCELSGPSRALLTGERTALNFLQTLSGVATHTRRYANALRGSGAVILDTRKTLPCLRLAEKYAVRQGGGENHRLGLHDRVLIKENHIAAHGSLSAAVETARRLHPTLKIEVETETLAEFREALASSADIIMLDNFPLEKMRVAVAKNQGRKVLEASGNVTLETVAAIAATGVDCISSGALTKDVKSVDFSMRIN
ncbi:MAG TPA: carboxylating nicotinate-nucleotide diphosphorylase [Gammaproteobacteria bacterium]|nr:carboxylating nicotinate-nucleotide diphosphorylase [Gammaproteobacteria bacterium]